MTSDEYVVNCLLVTRDKLDKANLAIEELSQEVKDLKFVLWHLFMNKGRVELLKDGEEIYFTSYGVVFKENNKEVFERLVKFAQENGLLVYEESKEE